MQVFAAPPLPDGIWLIKWIDGFSRLGSQFSLVDVLLQRLPLDPDLDPLTITIGLREQLVGSRTPEPPTFTTRAIQVGYLPLIRIGSLIKYGVVIGTLANVTRNIVLPPDARDATLADERPPPPGWTAGPYRVLNRYEYDLRFEERVGMLGRTRSFAASRCLLFSHEEIEYVLPKTTIFQAFFGCHSRLIDALLGGPWFQTSKEVLSFDHFESGITTGIDPLTQAWNIVLQTGLTEAVAVPIALLWHDAFAHAKVRALHTRMLQQPNYQYIDVDVPYEVGIEGFAMTVRGQPLKPFAGRERFLISSITGHAWPHPEQAIRWELRNSNRTGAETREVETDSYTRFCASVEGDGHAMAVSDMPADAQSPVNEFAIEGVSLWPEPDVALQEKSSSRSGRPAYPLPNEGAAETVTTGARTYRGSAAALAQLEVRMRANSRQFEFLMTAIEKLKGSGVVTAYDVLDPPAIRETRRGPWACWTFGDRGQTRLKRGWTVISKAGPDRKSRYLRSALIVQLRIDGHDLVLLDVEPRPLETTGRAFYVWSQEVRDGQFLLDVVQAIAAGEGVIRSQAAAPLRQMIAKIRHDYVYNEDGIATALQVDRLGAALLRQCGTRAPRLTRAMRTIG